jgi:hypothetical protein
MVEKTETAVVKQLRRLREFCVARLFIVFAH